MRAFSNYLTDINTLGVVQCCRQLIKVDTRKALLNYCQNIDIQQQPLLILGGGSNLVLTENFEGTVLKIETQGITITEEHEYFYLVVEAGEDWPSLVEYTIKQSVFGLENLALIPGTAGAAPIQNIGAYGVEFNQVCDWVEYWDLSLNQVKRISAADCQFDYRESIFKNALRNKAVIIRIGLKLKKHWQPNIGYGPLQDLSVETVTAKQVFDRVCEIRQDKLPDPKQIGNVGSFFKNPIVSSACYERLLKKHPKLVAYPIDREIKLAAGWLIDQAGLKGYRIGNVGVHDKQALVLVNYGGATGKDIVELAKAVADSVFNTFGVQLDVEPRLIGQHGEIAFHG